MTRSSIATRWFVNSFAVVAVIIAVLAVALFFMLRQYYYNSVEQLLRSEATIISGILARYHDGYGAVDPNEVRRSIEAFDKKNRMELMALDSAGVVRLSSSGFLPYDNYEMPDYHAAQNGADGFGRHVGRFNPPDSARAAEKYMAVTLILDENHQSTFGAIRLVASLEGVDAQIYGLTLFIGVLGISILLLLLFLGLYFIRSIVTPLRQIGNTARRLAGGDFSVRMAPTKNEDEIGELCRVINHMADELENSESLKNEFISSVSHELRTPLTAIKGWGETVLEMSDPEITQKGMNVIITETDRLTRMVEELLDFSRIQSKSLSLQREELDIIAELSETVTVYAERAHREGITIVQQAHAGDSPCLIEGDKHRIRQVILNVLDNAIKYSPRDSFIQIGTETLPEPRRIRISIKDFGCGISKADLPNVKMKFFKGNNTQRGSGIGLAIVDEIVTLHGGEVDIDSKQGKGTTVTVTLPLL